MLWVENNEDFFFNSADFCSVICRFKKNEAINKHIILQETSNKKQYKLRFHYPLLFYMIVFSYRAQQEQIFYKKYHAEIS